MDRFFGLSESNTTFRREILAGLSTFLTMSFIIAVNPMFLADAGIPFAAGFVATVLATSIGTAIMALWAKWPVAVAPGMGLKPISPMVWSLGGFHLAAGTDRRCVGAVLPFSLSRRSWLIKRFQPPQAGITAGIGLFSP